MRYSIHIELDAPYMDIWKGSYVKMENKEGTSYSISRICYECGGYDCKNCAVWKDYKAYGQMKGEQECETE